MQQGRLQEALPLLQQVLEQRLQLLHPDDPLIGAEFHYIVDVSQCYVRHGLIASQAAQCTTWATCLGSLAGITKRWRWKRELWNLGRGYSPKITPQ